MILRWLTVAPDSNLSLLGPQVNCLALSPPSTRVCVLSSSDSWEQNLILVSCVAGRPQDGGTELSEPLAALICASQQAEDHCRLLTVEGGRQ